MLALMTLLVALGSSSSALAQSSEPALAIPEVQQRPSLEDFLGDAPAVPALRIDEFVQRSPGDGALATEQTTAYLSRDREHLYVAFVCRDREPGKIRASLTRREQISGDDQVAVVLDTFRDRRRGYIFMVNPRGIQRDAVLTEGQNEDASFDTLWTSRGQLTANGYVVWMAIPFKSLRFSPGITSWGVGLRRLIPRTTEELFWPLVTRRVAGVVPQLATVRGFQIPGTHAHVQLIPNARLTDASYVDQSSGRHRSRETRGGFDGKLVLGDGFTTDVTFNPDFSHVETDDPQVTVNQRYEVYFPEKRPFFLENASTFQTPETLFFSRRIANPRWGARLSGKASRWNVAALVAEDRLPDRAGSSAERKAFIGVMRVQREVGRESALGALVTTRKTSESRNHVVSADLRLRMGAHWALQGQSARSVSEGSAVERADGSSTLLELTRTDSHFTMVSRYLARSPEFVPLLGFVTRTDIRQGAQSISYRWRPRSGKLLAFGPGITSSRTWDYSGRALDREVNPHFGFEFAGATQVLLSAFDNRETFAGTAFALRAVQLNVSSSRFKWMEVSGFAQRGTRINYAPAAGLHPFLGNTTDVFARVTLRPSSAIAIEQSYLFTELDGNTAIFSNHLGRTKLHAQITRALSARTIVDYGRISSDQGLSAVRPERRARADFLATYQLNVWTAFYLGYTEVLEDPETALANHAGLRRAFGLDSTGRQLFAKASCVVRF